MAPGPSCLNKKLGSGILVYSPLDKFLDIVVFNEGVLCTEPRLHESRVSAQWLVARLKILEYILKFY